MRTSALGDRTLVVFWDLTERKWSEAALRESELRYRIMAEQTGQLVYDYDVASGRIAWLGAIEQVTGYRPDEFRAIDITGWENLIHPEDRAEALHRRDMAMRLCGAYHVEYRFRRRAGDYVVIEDHGVFLPDANGNATRMLGTMGDVTRRRLAEQEVRDSAARVEQIFENSAEAIFVMRVNPDGTFTNESLNALSEVAIGRKRSEVCGRTLGEVFGPRMAEELGANFRRCLAAGEPIQYEESLDFGSGARIWQTTLVPIRDANGHAGRIAGFARDVTERRQAERARAALETQLRQAQKMEALGTLAGGIAHDFNNILTAVVGNLELLRMRVPEDPAAKENLDAMFEASRRAAELVRQILTFSRQREQERRIVSLSPIVREVGRLLRSALPSTIELRTSVESDLPPVLADPSQMHQVLMNLATNASHAMRGRGGRLEIRLEAVGVTPDMVRARPELREGPAVRLTMSDSGEGMEPAMLERIFEPFFTTKPPGEGTGLGLSVVHGIVRAHDGAIVVESQRGGGTTFHVYLPAVEEPQPDHAGRVSQAPRGHGERVLFVDDEPAVARVAESVLRLLGYEVSSRTSPVEALAELCTTTDRYDVLITDLTMPGMTGLELAERAHQQLPDLPILLTTGYSSELTLDAVRSLGIREFLPKPFTGESVGRLLRDTLASTGARGESAGSEAVPPASR
jgi:PAS domain S-box-containing protein